jgi:hypothetical protein
MERFHGRYVPPDETEFAKLLDRLIAFESSPLRQDLGAELWIKSAEHDIFALVALAEVTDPGHPGDDAVARRWFDANQGYLAEQRWEELLRSARPRDPSTPQLHDYRRDADWVCPMCGKHHHRWSSHPSE